MPTSAMCGFSSRRAPRLPREDRCERRSTRAPGRSYTNKGFKNGTYYRYAIISYDKAGNASRGIPVVVQPSVLLRSPRNGGRVPRAAASRLGKSRRRRPSTTCSCFPGAERS